MPCIMPKNMKCCLTCCYWCGERRINSSSDFFAESENCNTKGKCAKSSSWSSEKEATHFGCNDWKEWEALRK